MKLLLLALLGLVVLATAQDDPQDFVVLEERSDPDDVDQDVIQELEEQGKPTRYLKQLLTISPERNPAYETKQELSPGYTVALNASYIMFDDSSASNVEWGSSPTRDTGALSRVARQTPTNLYYCPHTNYLLRWFPVFWGSRLQKICFVPWATRQAITYAKCTNPTCLVRLNGTGRCRPSCYARRSILTFCFNVRTGLWSWSWEIRNLPQACRCSSC
ncbi:uncharacterized protein LOC143295672 [Babylonia areolata]|uniref:uncharacterized protein LOC143295672 n=1 Tax=Babylonia areolata TaxID=304850 RepID=UPI003FD63A16